MQVFCVKTQPIFMYTMDVPRVNPRLPAALVRRGASLVVSVLVLDPQSPALEASHRDDSSVPLVLGILMWQKSGVLVNGDARELDVGRAARPNQF